MVSDTIDPPPPPTIWQEGYMEGRALSGTIQSIPYGPASDEAEEWMLGFEAGRDALREGLCEGI